jgi:hypothetical protein
MEAAVYTLRTFSIVGSSWVCDSSCIIVLLKFWSLPYLYVVLTIKCVFVLILSVIRKYFKSHFFSLFEMQNMNHSVPSWWKKYVNLNTISAKYLLFFFPKLKFPLQLFLILFATGYEVLTVVRIHKLVWVRTSYNWYIIMTVVEVQSGSIFTVCQKMEVLCSDKTLVPTGQITCSHNREHYIF